MIVVDGNDGTGKTTLVAQLRDLGIEARDRGLPTKATDATEKLEPVPGEVYLVLDCAPETSHARLKARGADLTEEFHTLKSLHDYRGRFRQACASLGGLLIDVEGTREEVVAQVLGALCERGVSVPR